MSSAVLLLPGFGNSDAAHWQSLWERANPSFVRIAQRDWNAPVCADWSKTLDDTLSTLGPDTLLVAHSLACLLIAHHWAQPGKPPVAGALLVAPPDPTGPNFPAAAHGFAPLPRGRLPFPSRLVASSNDPYSTPDFSHACATTWGSDLVEIGAFGHINSSSGLGAWPAGLAFLHQLRGAHLR